MMDISFLQGKLTSKEVNQKKVAPNLSAPSPTAGCAKILILLTLQFIIEYIKENISC